MTAQGNSRILVTRGTGRLGRLVVARLCDEGCKVRVLSRHARRDPDGVEYVTGDLAKNTEIEAAADGAVRAGANLAPGRAVGLKTWDQYLGENVS